MVFELAQAAPWGRIPWRSSWSACCFTVVPGPFDFNGPGASNTVEDLPQLWRDAEQLQAHLEGSLQTWGGHARAKGYDPQVSTWTNNERSPFPFCRLSRPFTGTPAPPWAQVPKDYLYVLSMHRGSNMTLHYDPLPGVCYRCSSHRTPFKPSLSQGTGGAL